MSLFKQKSMKNLITLLLLLFSINLIAQTSIYSSPTNNNFYRIPALTATHDGSLVMVTDLRYGNNSDLGNHRIDLLVKRSTDHVVYWSGVNYISSYYSSLYYVYCDAPFVSVSVTGYVLSLSFWVSL